MFLQWINSQFIDADLLQTLMATLVDQFAEVELYQPERQVLMFVASDAPIDIWTGRQGAALALNQHRRHYNRMGLTSVEDVVAMMSLDAVGVRQFAEGAPLNTDDRNQLAFFSKPGGDGLTADSLLDLFGDIDPLTSRDGRFHRESGESMALPHIAERLLHGNFVQRTFRMARAVSDPSTRATLDALGYEYSGEMDRAESAFALALREDAQNQDAQTGLLRLHLGGIAARQIPPEIGRLANQQTGPVRRVLEGWVFGSAGDFETLSRLDGELARVPPTSLAYPIAVKLRVDWRVAFSQARGDAALAREAMVILDDLLASYWNMDLYVLRSGCAFLAGDGHAFVESVASAVRQLRNRLAIEASLGRRLAAEEAISLRARLDGMRERLASPIGDPLKERVGQVTAELDAVGELL